MEMDYDWNVDENVGAINASCFKQSTQHKNPTVDPYYQILTPPKPFDYAENSSVTPKAT